uniref:Uncharacterized protein n=1 Tax=Solanum lycopersicum TaxID=4081 RepID=A0A3Q7F5I6_SOLLC
MLILFFSVLHDKDSFIVLLQLGAPGSLPANFAHLGTHYWLLVLPFQNQLQIYDIKVEVVKAKLQNII